MEGTQEMLWEILNEVNESKQSAKIASTTVDRALVSVQKAVTISSVLYNKLKERRGLINKLKDVITDVTKTIRELCSKVDEYKDIIDCMEKGNEHRIKISSLEAYYQQVIEQNSLHYMMKHWVKNKMCGK